MVLLFLTEEQLHSNTREMFTYENIWIRTVGNINRLSVII